MATMTTDLQVYEHTNTLVPAQGSSLPSIAEVRQRMTWMAEFRPVLREYIQTQMDPARHMYSFENNRYTPMTLQSLATMLQEGKKPALNQDGIHNLMSLYDCYPDEPTIHELREDGFYTCRASIKLLSFRSGMPMGAGTGSCSTRESRYAYRWVSQNRIPKGMEAASLRQRELEGRSGKYTQYRLDNEDIADVEATVLQMAVKRAKSSAVKALPLVSEMFAVVGDPDEEKRRDDEARQELLGPLRAWLGGMRASTQVRALQAVFGEPLRANDVPKLEEDRLAVACRVVEIATQAGIDWNSKTLTEDVQRALRASAAKAKSDMFSDYHDATVPTTSQSKTKDDAQDAEIEGETDPGTQGPSWGPEQPDLLKAEKEAERAALEAKD